MSSRLISAIGPARGKRGAAIAAVTLAATLTLAGCGSSTASSTATPNAGGAGQSAAAGGRGGFGGAEFTKIRECLTAAGITLPTPSGRPSDFPSGRPSGFPSGFPSDRPSGGFRGGAGGFGSILTSSAAKAALKACGIALPSFGPRPAASPSA